MNSSAGAPIQFCQDQALVPRQHQPSPDDRDTCRLPKECAPQVRGRAFLFICRVGRILMPIGRSLFDGGAQRLSQVRQDPRLPAGHGDGRVGHRQVTTTNPSRMECRLRKSWTRSVMSDPAAPLWASTRIVLRTILTLSSLRTGSMGGQRGPANQARSYPVHPPSGPHPEGPLPRPSPTASRCAPTPVPAREPGQHRTGAIFGASKCRLYVDYRATTTWARRFQRHADSSCPGAKGRSLP